MAAGPVGTVWKSGSWTDTSWAAGTWASSSTAGNTNADLNTRLSLYLHSYYGLTPQKDLTSLTNRYMNGLTGERNARWAQMIDDATA